MTVTAPPAVQPPRNVTSVSPSGAGEQPPVVSASASALLPNGFAVSDGARLIFYNAAGRQTTTLALKHNAYGIHIAGRSTQGAPPVVYAFSQENSAGIAENTGGTTKVLVSSPEIFALRGAPGSPYFAYTEITSESDGLLSRLYAGTPGKIASSSPVMEWFDLEGFVPQVVALRVENGVPSGLWYTLFGYYFGGNLIADPAKSLVFINLKTGSSTEILGENFKPLSISPDGTWLGYTASEGQRQPFQLLNLKTGQKSSFPLLPRNDCLSRYAAFSPDGTLIA